MAKIAEAIGLAVTHRSKPRHGENGGARPAARLKALQEAVEQAVAEKKSVAETLKDIEKVRTKY